MNKKLSRPEDFAQYVEFPNGYPHIIVELGVARGGTTAMSHVLRCSPSFDAYGEDILRNAIAYPQLQGRDPVTLQMPGKDSYVILKETYGPATESMIAHFPLKVLQVAAKHAGISKKEFLQKTQVLAITKEPLATYNGWLKYWTITKNHLTSREQAFEELGELSMTNLIAAYNCLFETVQDAVKQGLKTTVIDINMFENPNPSIDGVIKRICERLGIEFTHDMVMFKDAKKTIKRDIYPVTIDAKYQGLHKELDKLGFRYFPPNYQYSSEVLPSLEKAGLIQRFLELHHIAEQTFGPINLPIYLTKNDA